MESVTNTEEPVLRVRDLRVTYKNGANPEICAVEDVDFSIANGEIVGLLGESGCGKTSLGMAVLGMLPPAFARSGTIYFRGKNLASLTPSEMRKVRGADIAMIFQDPALALHPLLRVREQVIEVLRAHRNLGREQCRKLVEELLGDLELGDVERIGDSYPHQLSGGQCQRILIAQSLICKPSLIIADEPTASLDLGTALEIINLIRRVNQRNSTSFLLISHDPAVLRALAHSIMVMQHGKIVEQGTANKVLTNTCHPYTRALLAAEQGVFEQGGLVSAETSSDSARLGGISLGR